MRGTGIKKTLNMKLRKYINGSTIKYQENRKLSLTKQGNSKNGYSWILQLMRADISQEELYEDTIYSEVMRGKVKSTFISLGENAVEGLCHLLADFNERFSKNSRPLSADKIKKIIDIINE